MQREELDQVRRLYRLFLVYARVEACGEKIPAAEQKALIPALVELSGHCWKQLFGSALDEPAHRRFVLEWCLRNLELLMKEEVLPVIAHQVVAQHIQTQLQALGGEAHGFSDQGPPGPVGTALRRVYLIQSLNQLLAGLALDGQIPNRLASHLTGHLIQRVRALFLQTLGESAESNLPDLAALLDAFREAGALTDDVALRLLRADAAAALHVSKPSGRVPIPAQGATSPEHVLLMAAAGELIRRLRRQPLAPEDRDRLIKRVEREMDDLLAALGPNRLDRALATLAERLGMPVPPPRDPGASSGAIPIPRPATPSADASDVRWTFELIEDLRRDSADGSSNP